MDESPEDQRAPHRLQPNCPVSLEQLRRLGVVYRKVSGGAGADGARPGRSAGPGADSGRAGPRGPGGGGASGLPRWTRRAPGRGAAPGP